MWLEEIQNIKEFYIENQIPSEPVNFYNRNGVNLDYFYFYDTIQHLVQKII